MEHEAKPLATSLSQHVNDEVRRRWLKNWLYIITVFILNRIIIKPNAYLKHLQK